MYPEKSLSVCIKIFSIINFVGAVGIEPTMFTARVSDFKSDAFQPASPRPQDVETYFITIL